MVEHVSRGYGCKNNILDAPIMSALDTAVIRAIVAQCISSSFDLEARFWESSHLWGMIRFSSVR